MGFICAQRPSSAMVRIDLHQNNMLLVVSAFTIDLYCTYLYMWLLLLPNHPSSPSLIHSSSPLPSLPPSLPLFFPPSSPSPSFPLHPLLSPSLHHLLPSIIPLSSLLPTLPLSFPPSPGARVDVEDKEGNTALHIAARHGHASVVKTLVSNGANMLK